MLCARISSTLSDSTPLCTCRRTIYSSVRHPSEITPEAVVHSRVAECSLRIAHTRAGRAGGAAGMGSKTMANLENDVKNLGTLSFAVWVSVADGRQEEVAVVVRHKLLYLQPSPPRVTRVSSTTARQALLTADSPKPPDFFKDDEGAQTHLVDVNAAEPKYVARQLRSLLL